MSSEVGHGLTPEEREQLAALFHKATGLILRCPSDATPVANLPAAWMAEFQSAVGPPLRAMHETANQKRNYSKGRP